MESNVRTAPRLLRIGAFLIAWLLIVPWMASARSRGGGCLLIDRRGSCVDSGLVFRSGGSPGCPATDGARY